jgi:small subunit ribosomal protein S6
MAVYDLFILLDPEAPEERRAAIVEQVKNQIDSGGATLKGDADWGMRRLSYEIDHRKEAQYHLFQFEGSREVLGQLHRSLSIDDSVLRHRIIRLPGEPPEKTPGPPEEAPRRTGEDRPSRDGGRDRRGEREGAPEAEETAAPAAATAVQDEPAPAEAGPTPEPAASEPPPVDSEPPPVDSEPPPVASEPPPVDSEPPPVASEPPPPADETA